MIDERKLPIELPSALAARKHPLVPAAVKWEILTWARVGEFEVAADATRKRVKPIRAAVVLTQAVLVQRFRSELSRLQGDIGCICKSESARAHF